MEYDLRKSPAFTRFMHNGLQHKNTSVIALVHNYSPGGNEFSAQSKKKAKYVILTRATFGRRNVVNVANAMTGGQMLENMQAYVPPAYMGFGMYSLTATC